MRKILYVTIIILLYSCTEEQEREIHKQWDKIEEAIMSVQTRKTNPLNIRKSGTKYQGEVQSSEAFKEFSHIKYGIRAGFVCLYTYEKKYGLKTIKDKIERFAPPHENNTSHYYDFVAKRVGVAPTDVVSMKDEEKAIAMVKAMCKIEDGKEADDSTVREAYELFKRDFLR